MKPRKLEVPVRFAPDGDGRHCGELLLDVLNAHQGIASAEIDFDQGWLRLRYDPALVSLEMVRALASDVGVAIERRAERCTLQVNGWHCRDCALALERTLQDLPGVTRASVNAAAHRLSVEYVSPDTELAVIQQQIERLGYRILQPGVALGWLSRHRELILAATCGITLLAAWMGDALGWLPASLVMLLYVTAYASGGYGGFVEAVREARQLTFNIDFLMITAALGAAAIGETAEGALLLFLFSLSGALETYAMDRTRSAIEALGKLRPDSALVRRPNGSEMRVPITEVEPGDIVVVVPGERLPVDGWVVGGHSTVDQSPITGESVPVPKRAGSEVFAGTINNEGSLEIRVGRRAEESTLAKVIKLVEEAQAERAPTQRFIDRFSQPYTFAVIGAVLLMIVIPYFILGHDFDAVIYRAMTLLVVASPCALVISTPASILSAIAGAARQGVLFKGGVHLENMARVDIVAFDKTGTLTRGRPELTDVVILHDSWNEPDLLRLVAAAEQRSEHPLARALVQAAQERAIEFPEATDFRAERGRGVRATVDGRTVLVGNLGLVQEAGVAVGDTAAQQAAALQDQGKTVMWVLVDNALSALIAMADQPRPDAADVVARLKQTGIRKVVMLTGDNARVATAIARELGVDEYAADLLPQDKVAQVKHWQQEGSVLMVGDGVNDAPALATASVGVAMGAAGTDVALEAADVVLMSDEIGKLPFAVELSRRSARIIRQNVAISIGVMGFLALTTILVGIPLPLGVVGHEGSTLLVVANGLRLLAARSR